MSTKMPVGTSRSRTIPSDNELMALPEDGYKRELLHGEIIMTPAGSEHGSNISRFTAAIASHVYAHKLGEIFDGQTGFRMESRDVLSPDISFVSRERLIRIGGVPEGFFEGAPDLAIEFLSPRESLKRMRDKVDQYLSNGTRLVWVMDSRRKTVTVHQGTEAARVLGEAEELSGGEVVAGFQFPVADVFAGADYRS